MNSSYRVLAAAFACIAWGAGCAGDDTDPDSDTCKQIRSQYIKAKTLRDEAAAIAPNVSTAEADAALAELVNKHWACFH